MSKDRVQVAYRIISVPLHRLQALSCTCIQRAVQRALQPAFNFTIYIYIYIYRLGNIYIYTQYIYTISMTRSIGCVFIEAIDFPPLLDEFSRTIATPYGEDLHHGSSSGRIACHLSPLSAMLVGLSDLNMMTSLNDMWGYIFESMIYYCTLYGIIYVYIT